MSKIVLVGQLGTLSTLNGEGFLMTVNRIVNKFGNITVSGGGVRMRGLMNEGLLTVNANLYSAAFCVLNDADIKGNEVSLIRNVFNGTQVSVPSSSAVLLDNTF